MVWQSKEFLAIYLPNARENSEISIIPVIKRTLGWNLEIQGLIFIKHFAYIINSEKSPHEVAISI